MKNIYLFIFIIIITFLSFIIGSFSIQKIILFLIPVVYSAYYCAKSIFLFFRSKFLESAANFLIGLLCILVLVKIHYVYYNPVESIFLIAVCFIFIKNFYSKANSSNLTKSLIALAIMQGFLVFLPDKLIISLLSLSDNRIAWKPDLDWDDFSILDEKVHGQVYDSVYYQSAIYTNYSYQINKAFNYPPIVAIAHMDKIQSYKSKEIEKGMEKPLLEHEQGHFNMMQLYIKMAEDSISKLWGKDERVIKSVIDYFGRKKIKDGAIYDLQTNHGVDTVQQNKWSKRL